MNKRFSVNKVYNTSDIYVIYREGEAIAVIYDEKIAYDFYDFLNEKFEHDIPNMSITFLKDSYN